MMEEFTSLLSRKGIDYCLTKVNGEVKNILFNYSISLEDGSMSYRNFTVPVTEGDSIDIFYKGIKCNKEPIKYYLVSRFLENLIIEDKCKGFNRKEKKYIIEVSIRSKSSLPIDLNNFVISI